MFFNLLIFNSFLGSGDLYQSTKLSTVLDKYYKLSICLCILSYDAFRFLLPFPRFYVFCSFPKVNFLKSSSGSCKILFIVMLFLLSFHNNFTLLVPQYFFMPPYWFLVHIAKYSWVLLFDIQVVWTDICNRNFYNRELKWPTSSFSDTSNSWGWCIL